MADKNETILIVGGGVIGGCAAYYLSRAGYRVSIVDKGTFGGGCSLANCGFICPSHALPLCVPEALLKPIKAMFSSHSPFYVNPMVGPSLWRWLIRFAMNCNRNWALKAARARHLLLASSRQLYDAMIEKEKMDCQWRQDGLLFVFTNPRSLDHCVSTHAFLEKEFGLEADFYDSTGAVELEPALKEGLAGACHYVGDAHLKPERYMAELKRVLLARGVKIIEDCQVTDLALDQGRIAAVQTSQGEMQFNKLLLATGAMAPALGQKLGLKLSIQPGKGYSLLTDRPRPCPRMPMILEDHHVAVTPFDEDYSLGSTMEFGGYDDSINPRRLALLEQGARHYLHEPIGENVIREWCGWRPMSSTGLPVICRTQKYKNSFVAAGHSMLGMSMGPGTGKLIAEIISGDKPHLDLAPYEL